MKDSIVFFAPNSRIAALASNAISQMKLSIPVEQAIDYEAVEHLHKYPSCKIAISRSGTADLLTFAEKIKKLGKEISEMGEKSAQI